MPVEFPQYPGQGDSRPMLARFVVTVRDFLAELIETRHDAKGAAIFMEEVVEAMQAAWREAEPEFFRVADAVMGMSDEAIREHGLFGSQLHFKLMVIEVLNGRYRQAGGIGPLRRLIGAIDTLLKSILAAIGGGEAIKEIKEYIEHSLGD